MKKKYILIAAGTIVVVVLVLLFWPWKRLPDTIGIPYIAHQKPQVDPHLPASDPLSDKLDEVLFDGLFNVSADPSGITYEDGLGELVGTIGPDFVVTIKLKTDKKWHDSYQVKLEDDEVTVSEGSPRYFSAQDLSYTLKRIEQLGSLSPDYILVSQALEKMGFSGPTEQNEIQFKFKQDRIWTDSDIKEVLSFKILPENAEISAAGTLDGSGPYLAVTPKADVSDFYKNLSEKASITNVKLKPFIDNSTYPSELKGDKINVLLDTPFGSLSPTLSDHEDYFTKSNVSTTFFAILFNVERVPLEKRKEFRNLINNETVLNRFFKFGSPQQRPIVDYKGNVNNYSDYLNFSVFPSSTYYVEEKIVELNKERKTPDLSLLTDTLQVKACLNFGLREEYTELIEILNDPTVTAGRVQVTAVSNDEIKSGNYDAVLVAFTGYRSTFLFDLYNIFLREPDLATYQINLITEVDLKGKMMASPGSFTAARNFFRMDCETNTAEAKDYAKLLEYIYGFMSTREIGDKQAYSQFVDQTVNDLSLGTWLFSEPSLAYFSTQFDSASVDLYGVASQLSTIEKWKERKEK